MSNTNSGVFINLLTDFGFKYIFGNVGDTDFLISLLNAVFGDKPHIKKIEKIDKELTGETESDRTTIYDVHCLTDEGEIIIVEMQNQFQEYYRDRSIYYMSKDIVAQGMKGNDWKFNLNPVYGVFLMNFDWKDQERDLIRDEVCLTSKITGEEFSDKLRMYFLKIPLMKKKAEECESDFDIWMYIFKHIDKMETMPATFRDKPLFLKLEEKARIGALTADEKRRYDISLKHYRDNLAVESGVQYRIDKSFEMGKAEEKRDIAISLLQNGVAPHIISRSTGLSLDELEKLKS